MYLFVEGSDYLSTNQQFLLSFLSFFLSFLFFSFFLSTSCITQTYLSNEEFFQVFKMDRLKFNALPKWKRDNLKKAANIF